MKKTQKILFIIVGVLIVCSFIVNISLYSAFKIIPDQLKVNYQTIKDSKIPEGLNDVSIAYFTDLEYGEFENEKRLEKLINTVQETHPDILIFGGDFFDDDFEVNEEITQKMINYLNEIEAPMGKFAVWGEKDVSNENHKSALDTIYAQAQIEVLDNSSVKITNGNKDGIKLIGLSTEPNFEYVSANTSKNEFNILVTHKPDVLTDPSLAYTSLALAGHSHGTQISYPVIGGYQDIEGATNINRNIKADVSFEYIISAGVGCTNINARYNATPEVYYFILRHKK